MKLPTGKGSVPHCLGFMPVRYIPKNLPVVRGVQTVSSSCNEEGKVGMKLPDYPDG
jgi:hypothetical protein